MLEDMAGMIRQQQAGLDRAQHRKAQSQAESNAEQFPPSDCIDLASTVTLPGVTIWHRYLMYLPRSGWVN